MKKIKHKVNGMPESTASRHISSNDLPFFICLHSTIDRCIGCCDFILHMKMYFDKGLTQD